MNNSLRNNKIKKEEHMSQQTFKFENTNYSNMIEKLTSGYVLQIQSDMLYPINWANGDGEFIIHRDQWIIEGYPSDKYLMFKGTQENIEWFKRRFDLN